MGCGPELPIFGGCNLAFCIAVLLVVQCCLGRRCDI